MILSLVQNSFRACLAVSSVHNGFPPCFFTNKIKEISVRESGFS